MRNSSKLLGVLTVCALILAACGRKADDSDYNRLDLGTVGGAYQDENLTKRQKEYLKKVQKWRNEIVWNDGSEDVWIGEWLGKNRVLTFDEHGVEVEADGEKQSYKIEVADDPLTSRALLEMTDDELSLFMMNYDLSDTETLFRVKGDDGEYYYYTIEVISKSDDASQSFDAWGDEEYGTGSLTDTKQKLTLDTYSGIASGDETQPMPKEIDILNVLDESGSEIEYSDYAEMRRRADAGLEAYKQGIQEKSWGYKDDTYAEPMQFLTFDGNTCTVEDYDGNVNTMEYSVYMEGKIDNPYYCLEIDGTKFYVVQFVTSHFSFADVSSIPLYMDLNGLQNNETPSGGWLVVSAMDQGILGMKNQSYVGTWISQGTYTKIITLYEDGTGIFELNTSNLENGGDYTFPFTYNIQDDEISASSYQIGLKFGADASDFSGIYYMSYTGEGLGLLGESKSVSGDYIRQ